MRLTTRGRIVALALYLAILAALVATVAQGYGECLKHYSSATCAE